MMKNFSLLVALTLLLPVSLARGQGNPFDDVVDEPRDRITTRPRSAPEEPEEPEEDVEDITDPNDPVIATIREQNPSTAPDLLRAVNTLVDYGAPTEARKYLAKLIELKPSEAELIELQEEFGSALFMKMRRDKQLGDDGSMFAKAVMDAAYKWASDPKRIGPLIEELKSNDRDVLRAAIVDLQKAGEGAVQPLLAVLADRDRAAEHHNIRLALGGLGTAAADPLIATLNTDDDALRAHVIRALGLIGAPHSTVFLLRSFASKDSDPVVRAAAAHALRDLTGSTPSAREVENYLLNETERFLDGIPPRKPDHENKIAMYVWNPAQQKAEKVKMLSRDASLYVAAHTSSDLFALFPKNYRYRRLYLVANLESDKLRNGLDQPLPSDPGSARERVRGLGVEAIEDVLSYAMKEGRVAAAIGAVEVLGDLKSQQVLRGEHGTPTPLVDALHHPDRRLRLAAADAIMRIDPSEGFPGSSRVPRALAFLAGASGLRRALVAHPNASEAQSMVGALLELGFEAESALSGHEVFKKASNSPDWEILLISDAISNGGSHETVQFLRRDPRTALIPVGLMVRSEDLQQAKLWARTMPLTEAFPRPYELESMQFQIRRLLMEARRSLVPVEERTEQAKLALHHLVQIAENRKKYEFYKLDCAAAVEPALFDSELAGNAARILGLIGSPEAQRALVDMASQNMLPLKQRQAGASAFDTAVRKRGVLLNSEEVELQYDRYNQSERLDVETQNLLGSILDSIESVAKPKTEAPE
jgi:hypothetical protein